MIRMISMVLVVTMLISSCSKSGDAVSVKDTEAPIVKILGPVSLQRFTTGDPLCIKATVFDKGVISRASIKIIKEGQPTPLVQYDYTVNETTFTIDTKVIVPASMTGNCTLLIEANDTFGNWGQATIGFSGN